MTKKVILVPSHLDLVSALGFSVALAGLDYAERFQFDFRQMSRIEPFPMLLISSEIVSLRKRFADSTVECVNHEGMQYAAHMGFFRAFQMNFGKAPGEARGSARYIPLTLFSCDDLIKEAARKGVEVGDEVEEESRRMASMLCGAANAAVQDTLAYSVRELMRNVVEHSRAKQFGICAQHWPSEGKVEVAILDRGIGLKESLAPNPHLDASDDKKAINYALMPAVSGKAFKGTRVKQRGPWANSGFGLYMTNRICRNGGTFFIATGNTGTLLTKGGGKRYFPCKLRGTAIRMVMRTSQIEGLRESLEKYRKEGYEIQKRYKEIVKIDPSSASLMLSDDFDLSTWDKLLLSLKSV